MQLKPRSINPGQKRAIVDPKLAAVLTRIISREVERQLVVIHESFNKIMEEQNKKLEELAITLASMGSAAPLGSGTVSSAPSGRAVYTWNNTIDRLARDVIDGQRTVSGTGQQVSSSYTDLVMSRSNMQDDIGEFMSLLDPPDSAT